MTVESSSGGAVQDLYLRYAADVYRLAMQSTHDHAEAEDIVHEVFLRVLCKWDDFRGDAHVKTWIWRIAKNYLIDSARRRMRQQELMAEVGSTYRPNLLVSLIEFEDAIHRLPDQQQRVLDLRVVQDLSVADTANVLGCSEGKVRVDTHRALSRMKKVFYEGVT